MKLMAHSIIQRFMVDSTMERDGVKDIADEILAVVAGVRR